MNNSISSPILVFGSFAARDAYAFTFGIRIEPAAKCELVDEKILIEECIQQNLKLYMCVIRTPGGRQGFIEAVKKITNSERFTGPVFVIDNELGQCHIKIKQQKGL